MKDVITSQHHLDSNNKTHRRYVDVHPIDDKMNEPKVDVQFLDIIIYL